ncbi:MAG: amino acid ABC transporter substrate-binding protein, partial [Flavobacteriales bacterium]
LELDGEYILYRVPRRQTLYSISKEHNTSIADLIDANPELSEGLKVGSTIRIPVPKILEEKDSAKETMVGLPDIVRKEETSLFVKTDELVENSVTHITLMLPLYLDLNDTINEARDPDVEEEIYAKSEIALQFYEGFLLALDTLEKQGYSVKLKVIDTENRPWKVRKLVEKGALKNTDLIVGPLYSKVFNEVAGYAFDNCIPMVSPTIKDQAIIAKNDYVFKMIPSAPSLAHDLGRYLSQSDSTTNMVLHYGSPDEQKLLWRFRQGLEASGQNPQGFPAFDIYKAGSDSIRNRLSLTGRNNLVILSNDQVKLASLLRKLTSWSEDAYLVAYAPHNWQRFRNLEIDHFDQLRLHMPAEFHVDYEQLETQQMVQEFRLRYQGEPNTFAFRGYDVAMHFVKNMGGIKQHGLDYMLAVEETGFQSAFGWRRLENGGLENTRSRIVDFTDLQLKLATD